MEKVVRVKGKGIILETDTEIIIKDYRIESAQILPISPENINIKTINTLFSDKETKYLLSIPGMLESIKKGMETPIEDCKKEIDW